jgi:hypothetical protein
MIFARISWLLTLVLLTGCSEKTESNSPGSSPLMPDTEVVFLRNRGDPSGEGYSRIDPKTQLGKAVYGVTPTQGWRDLLRRMAEDDANPFPLLYAEDRLFPDGKSYLVAAQLEVRLIGDGSWSPGPVMGCRLFTIDRSNPDKPILIWKGFQSLGTLQHSKVHRGVADPGDPGAFLVVVDEENGGQFRSRTLRFGTSPSSEIRLERIKD